MLFTRLLVIVFACLAFCCSSAMGQQANAVSPFYMGNSVQYPASYPDTYTTTGNSTSTNATIEIIAGTANKTLYIWYLGAELTATAAASETVQFEWGTGSTCSGSTVTMFPAALNPGIGPGLIATYVHAWTSAQQSQPTTASSAGIFPALVPLVIAPIGGAATNVCMVTGSVNNGLQGIAYYALR